jgi:hypothetical protein
VTTGGDGGCGFAFFFLSALSAFLFAAGFLVTAFFATGFLDGKRLAVGLSEPVLGAALETERDFGVAS